MNEANRERREWANGYAAGKEAQRGELEWLRAEVERLTLENWQLKGALGYPVPGNIPEGPFKCGLCDARRVAAMMDGQ